MVKLRTRTLSSPTSCAREGFLGDPPGPVLQTQSREAKHFQPQDLGLYLSLPCAPGRSQRLSVGFELFLVLAYDAKTVTLELVGFGQLAVMFQLEGQRDECLVFGDPRFGLAQGEQDLVPGQEGSPAALTIRLGK